MKKLTFLLLSLTLCFLLAFGSVAQAVVITVDGNEVKQVNQSGDPIPEVDGSLVPIRAVLNAMGYSIAYDEETGLVSGGTFADPEFVFTPGEGGSALIDGTTFVDPVMLTNGLPFTVEIDDAGIAYTNTFSEMTEGWYHISLNGQYLTAQALPENDLVETITKDDGTTEEKITTPTQQILATKLFLAEDNGSDYQLWLMRKVGNNTYALINRATGLAADVLDWRRDNGAPIIQYTLAAGTNQQFTFGSIDDGYSISPVYSRLYLTNVADDKFATEPSENVVIQSSDESTKWNLEYVEPYVNPVELVLETEAFAELDPHIQERFQSYFFTDVDFSKTARDKAETMLRNADFASADKETQKTLIESTLSITYSDLLGGWMRNKLTGNYKIVSVTRTHDTYPDVLEQEDAKDYYIYTIAMECNGPDDIHNFTVQTIEPDDEDYVRLVCEAVACYEPPVRKTLRHFYYTGDKLGTWNAWDGEIWNNTGNKNNVDGMLTLFSHELGHVIDSYFTVGDDVWRRAINSDIIPTSGYGNTNRWEDFGEFSRLYLMARGDEDRIAAIEKIYPARTKTYRAALYNADHDYYARYKDEYDEVTAPIGNTDGIDEGMYYTITTDDGALTNNDGVVTIEKNTEADNQLWQISVLNEQLVRFYSKADGKALYVPGVAINTPVKASFEGSTAFGVDATGQTTPFIVTETGYALKAAIDDGSVIAINDGTQSFVLTPVEKVEGMGKFVIKSGDKYLAPETEERGAQLTLSDDDTLSVWYINKLPNNVGYITNTANDFAIDISGVSMDEGAAALTYTLSRNANQMWLIIENENGTVSFQAQHSSLYLAVDKDGKAIQSETPYEWTMEAID